MLAEGTSLTVGSHNVKVVRYLSEGGFSKIYEVTMDPKEGDTEIGCLKQVIVPDKNGLNTLRKEVDVMKTLRKARSIVKYYDSNAERLPDGSYQVLVLMELCPNNSLLDYMNERIRSKLTEPEILKIMLDISIGVYEMHKIKLIHRDIKIENVLIGAKKDFKLCDFGSVATPTRAPQDQQEFQSLSHDILYHTTPQYRSPEMIDLYRGFPIDERSDIWALGCFLYKLCYFTTPFEANGDVAILHASFQFPPLPVYSGDLKNLVIIMLQENPVYRPNIVQILILVSKLISADFSSLKIDDFYGAGEYNFQALHEMQREKHNQLLKQQQYYLEQQKQQQAYDASKQKAETSKSSSRASPSHLSRESSVNAKGNETPVSSIKNELESSTKEEIGRVDGNAVHVTGGNETSSGIPQGLVSNETSPKLDVRASSPESEDLDVDLPELDNIAERFPSLDDIIITESNEQEDLHRTSSTPNPRASLDTNVYGSALETVSSRDIHEMPVAGKTKSQTDLESVDAWQRDATPKCDEKTERLADEIFSVGAGEPQRKKSSSSSTSNKEVPRRSLDLSRAAITSSPVGVPHAAEVHAAPLKLENGPEGGMDIRSSSPLSSPKQSLDYTSRPGHTVTKPTEISAPALSGKVNPYAAVTKHHEGQFLDISRPEARRASSNPWGSAIQGSAIQSPNFYPQERPADVTDTNLHKHISNLNLGSHFSSAAEKNLIDLEGPEVLAAVANNSDQFKKPAKVDKSSAKAAQNAVSSSLIDMNFAGLNVPSEESRPSFKKRISDIPTQPLNFQEQVIDFESDDETRNSEMSRVSIRNSLKKSRKQSDHRRSDSSHAEGKKRLSFFGGSSD